MGWTLHEPLYLICEVPEEQAGSASSKHGEEDCKLIVGTIGAQGVLGV